MTTVYVCVCTCTYEHTHEPAKKEQETGLDRLHIRSKRHESKLLTKGDKYFHTTPKSPTIWASHTTSGDIPEGVWSAYYRDTCASVIITSFIKTVSKWSRPRCPSTREERGKLRYACSSECYLAIKKKAEWLEKWLSSWGRLLLLQTQIWLPAPIWHLTVKVHKHTCTQNTH